MAKTWVLDTETKGTGANMVPLEKLLRRGGEPRGLDTVKLGRAPDRAPAVEPAAPAPLRFRVVDVLSGTELGRDLSTRDALGELTDMRTALDARIYVWVPASQRWRLLTLAEHRLMWGFRDQLGAGEGDAEDSEAGASAALA
jgi:hypothetical protein